MSEGLNPTRRYKWFRPRQAARGRARLAGPINTATVALFNNALGRKVMIVRAMQLGGSGGSNVVTSYQKGSFGGAPGIVQPLVPESQTPPGLLTTLDSVTVYPGDFSIANAAAGDAWWEHDFPFAVIPSGWSLVLQQGAVTRTIDCSLMWESIDEDQLDFMD